MSMSRWVSTRPLSQPEPCIEVGALSYGDFSLRTSDFKRRTLVVTREQFEEFVAAVKAGRFDRLLEVPK